MLEARLGWSWGWVVVQRDALAMHGARQVMQGRRTGSGNRAPSSWTSAGGVQWQMTSMGEWKTGLEVIVLLVFGVKAMGASAGFINN